MLELFHCLHDGNQEYLVSIANSPLNSRIGPAVLSYGSAHNNLVVNERAQKLKKNGGEQCQSVFSHSECTPHKKTANTLYRKTANTLYSILPFRSDQLQSTITWQYLMGWQYTALQQQQKKHESHLQALDIENIQRLTFHRGNGAVFRPVKCDAAWRNMNTNAHMWTTPESNFLHLSKHTYVSTNNNA